MNKSTPVNISRYIAIKTDDPVDKEVMHDWFKTAKELLPSGTLTSIQTTDESGALRGVSMVHREIKDKHQYIIPISRDLSDSEVQPVVDYFFKKYPELDFDIEVSSSQVGSLRTVEPVKIDDGKYLELCTSWAKKQHDVWFKDRLNSGWRYGTSVSLKNKTHPLVRPWHELPDQFKKIDVDQPQSLLDLLNDQGYSVMDRSELGSLLRLLKGN